MTFKVIFTYTNAISQERVDRLTLDESHLDRWLTENNLDVKSEGNYTPRRGVQLVCPSVHLSVCPSVCPDLKMTVTSKPVL